MTIISNLPDRWDDEFDLVVIGSGIGGLSSAITAHDSGLKAIMLERSDQVGGVTALSQGQVWISGNHHAAKLGIEDSAESGFRYLQRLSMGYGEDEANSAARMESGAVMQSGVSNSRGMNYGWLAGRHAAGVPSDLLDKEIQRIGQ